MKKKKDLKVKKEINFIKLDVKNSGFLTKFADPAEVKKLLKPRPFHYKDGFKQPHSKNKQKGPFYGKFYFTLDKWNEEKILNSPFNWILNLTEEEYV